jgi:putative hydrolase of the HAD superfamily
MMKYQAVIFDLFGTLVDIFSVKEYNRVLVEMASHLKAPYNDFHKIWMQTANRRVIGGFCTLEGQLEYICRKLKIKVNASQIQAACRARFDYIARSLKPREYAIEVLSQLKADGYKIGLISNCSTEPPIIWPNTPFAPYFDITIFSSTAGLKKPDRRIFKMAVERLKVRPSKCVYIGDGGDDELKAAADFGMTTILIRATHEDGADALRPNDNITAFNGRRITSLKEVLNLVK